MKTLSALVLGWALLAVAGAALADDKKKDADQKKGDAAKLLGTWEITKHPQLVGAKLEFKKDGKLVLTAKDGDNELKLEGTYELKKDTLITKIADTPEDTDTIKKFTDDVLELENGSGVETHLKKAKK